MSLGPPIRKPPEPQPEWKPHPTNPALEVNQQGQLRTKAVPLPPFLPLPVLVEDGQEEDWIGACW